MEKKKTFEEKMKRVDELTQAMEKNDLSLQESVAYFEEGTKLIQELQIELEEAQKKYEQYMSAQDIIDHKVNN